MSNIDKNIKPRETQMKNEVSSINEIVFTSPTQLVQTPFKSIQWINGAWSITPWPDVPPIPE